MTTVWRRLFNLTARTSAVLAVCSLVVLVISFWHQPEVDVVGHRFSAWGFVCRGWVWFDWGTPFNGRDFSTPVAPSDLGFHASLEPLSPKNFAWTGTEVHRFDISGFSHRVIYESAGRWHVIGMLGWFVPAALIIAPGGWL